MKKISICYTPEGNHTRTVFFEDTLSEHNALKFFNWSKVGDYIEVLGGPTVSIPQFYDPPLLDELVTTLSDYFNCEVDYNNTSRRTDRMGSPH